VADQPSHLWLEAPSLHDLENVGEAVDLGVEGLVGLEVVGAGGEVVGDRPGELLGKGGVRQGDIVISIIIISSSSSSSTTTTTTIIILTLVLIPPRPPPQ
jgi:hypothetical protein